ncbi:glycosyltransferase family 2 protein [Clostridium botulinum]|uniref:glycosyltransferase family 2 protein n=1 Tax=Clostridium botulinum TaxID=1491 RepID=UPI0013FF1B90|nr:glycosyltransferase family 2 protein [Clostridium botulinum]MBN1073448.1 glycosyltransferase family 2 protein [Clostridium botulinum]NFN14812.1 glycosyltransferase family 2 protein [Clostridium botulinum]
MKLSIAMIVKNEERNLERTLIPLKELCEYLDGEIIIVDTGSTDKTIEIAKKYADKVYCHEWCGDFSEMRNISIGYCKGEWILIVDADEVLYDIKKLADLINKNYISEYNGIFVKIVDFIKNIDNTLKEGHVSPILRILRKDCAKYKGKVHEQPMFIEPLVDSDIRFIHYGYDNFDSQLMEYKFKRNIKLLFEELKNDNKNIYVNFQISTSYLMHGDIKDSYKYIKIAYKYAKNNLKTYIYVIDKYCLILYKMGLYDELIEKAIEGINLKNNFLDFYFYLGEGYNNINKNKKAIEIYKQYLDLLETESHFFDSTLSVKTKGYRNIVLYNISINYYKLKMYSDAIRCINVIDDKTMIYSKIMILIRSIFEGQIYDEINKLNMYIDKDNYEKMLTYIQKECTLQEINIIIKKKPVNKVKEILEIVQYFKRNNNIDEYIVDKIKEIIQSSGKVYTMYLYYLLKYNINEINNLLEYGKEDIEVALKKICLEYFDINQVLINNIDSVNVIENKVIIEEALLYARKIDIKNRKKVFLNYIADKYFYMVNLYNQEIIKENAHLLPNEERCIIELKKSFSYKYVDKLKYIKLMKKTLNIYDKYSDYIKFFIEEIDIDNDNINAKIADLIPQLKLNIYDLIANKKYGEAYYSINDTLEIIKYDFDLMILKYRLLNKFDYIKDANECLREIILYGENDKVIKFINGDYKV